MTGLDQHVLLAFFLFSKAPFNNYFNFLFSVFENYSGFHTILLASFPHLNSKQNFKNKIKFLKTTFLDPFVNHLIFEIKHNFYLKVCLFGYILYSNYYKNQAKRKNWVLQSLWTGWLYNFVNSCSLWYWNRLLQVLCWDV